MVVMSIDFFTARPEALVHGVVISKAVGAQDGWVDPRLAVGNDIGDHAADTRRPIDAPNAARGCHDETADTGGLGNDQPSVG